MAALKSGLEQQSSEDEVEENNCSIASYFNYIGSLVFTVPIASLTLNLMSNQGIINFENNTQSALVTLSSAAGLSLVVSAVDWILGKME